MSVSLKPYKSPKSFGSENVAYRVIRTKDINGNRYMPFNHSYLLKIGSGNLKKLQVDVASQAIWNIIGFFLNLGLRIIKSKWGVTIAL